MVSFRVTPANINLWHELHVGNNTVTAINITVIQVGRFYYTHQQKGLLNKYTPVSLSIRRTSSLWKNKGKTNIKSLIFLMSLWCPCSGQMGSNLRIKPSKEFKGTPAWGTTLQQPAWDPNYELTHSAQWKQNEKKKVYSTYKSALLIQFLPLGVFQISVLSPKQPLMTASHANLDWKKVTSHKGSCTVRTV